MKKATAVGVVTATVTALAMGAAPPPLANAAPPPIGALTDLSPELTAAVASLVSSLAGELPSNQASPTALAETAGSPGLPLMELAPGAPDPASIPDLTFGLDTSGYDLFQTLGAALESGIVDNFNLSGLLQALGYDPESVINAALGALLVNALAGIPVDLSGIPVLGAGLAAAGIDNVAALLGLLGFNLDDPLNLDGLPTPGINIITAGPPFTLLKLLGVDLGWVPGFPNSVADEINGTPYLDISALGLIDTLIPLSRRHLRMI
ncbi:hypothetical protein BH09ACT7_BH09ACT7_43990 [soil metagenome]